MSVPAEDRDPAKTCNTDGCHAWATDQSDKTRCRNCGGESTGAPEGNNNAAGDGAPEGNQNATTHGLNATPEYLVKHLDESRRDDVIATFEGLVTRYERVHGHEADYPAKKRLRRISIELLKQDLADEWLAEEADDSGHLLMEQREAENGRTYEVPNAILEPMTALKRETRLALKDMGLLQDPDTKQADATATLADVIERE